MSHIGEVFPLDVNALANVFKDNNDENSKYIIFGCGVPLDTDLDDRYSKDEIQEMNKAAISNMEKLFDFTFTGETMKVTKGSEFRVDKSTPTDPLVSILTGITYVVAMKL